MYIRRVLSLLLATMLLSIAGMSVATASETAPHQEKEAAERRESEAHPPEPVASIQLAGGSELIFYELLADDGTSRGIGVGQFIPARGMDPGSVRELHGANPHELFYALSDHAAEIPHILSEMYANRYGKQPQGWALEKIKPSFDGIISCKNTEQSFGDAVLASGLPIASFDLSKGPHNSPIWTAENPNDAFPSYVTTKKGGVVGDEDVYFRVMFCEEDPMFAATSVNVRLEYKESFNGGYNFSLSGEFQWQLHNPGGQMSFMSWPFYSNLGGKPVLHRWFYTLTVEDVQYMDTLHIGMAWN